MKDNASCLSLELPIAVNSSYINATVDVHMLANGNVIVGDKFFKDYKPAAQQDIIYQLNKAHGMSAGVSRWCLAYQAVIEALVNIRKKRILPNRKQHSAQGTDCGLSR
jgi:hypothetical protein